MIWGWATHIFCKYICPQGVLEGALPLSAVNEGIRSALGKPVFVETCCADFGSRFERAVLQTVLQMDLPTRCILCTVQQGFAA